MRTLAVARTRFQTSDDVRRLQALSVGLACAYPEPTALAVDFARICESNADQMLGIMLLSNIGQLGNWEATVSAASSVLFSQRDTHRGPLLAAAVWALVEGSRDDQGLAREAAVILTDFALRPDIDGRMFYKALEAVDKLGVGALDELAIRFRISPPRPVEALLAAIEGIRDARAAPQPMRRPRAARVAGG